MRERKRRELRRVRGEKREYERMKRKLKIKRARKWVADRPFVTMATAYRGLQWDHLW